MKKSLWTSVLVLLTLTPAFAAVPRFSVKVDDAGKLWFIDPQGRQFLSIGVNNINPVPRWPREGTQYYDPVAKLFGGDFDAWKKDVFTLLQEHGFNTVGSWSDGRLHDGPLYGTICLYVAAHAQDRCLDGLRPGFEERVKENANIILADNPYLDNVLGVFLDNEMPWFGHAPWGDIPNSTLLEAALALPSSDAAHQAAIDFVKQRYSSIEAIGQAWGKPLASWDALTVDFARSCINDRVNKDRADFIGRAADAFYKTSSEVVRQLLPGKLILGTRFAEYAPQPVVEACGRYCDVISFNHYTRTPAANTDLLAKYWIWGGQKPLMVTEYSWRAEENASGNPNSGGAGAVVKTQAQRGESYSKYVEDLLSYPMVIGAHWFEFNDQSPQGRFDGENSNYGIVDIYHRPYKELLSAMKATNDRIVKLHGESQKAALTELPKPRQVVFEPGQYPDKPASVDILNTEAVRAPEVFEAPDAKVNLAKKGDYLAVDMDSGSQWGCGIILFGPKAFKNAVGPELSTNLDGYSAVVIDAVIGQGVAFELFFDEAAVAAPEAGMYDGSGGDDGEAFVLSGIQGVDGRHEYRLELKNLQPRTNWGNQKGLRKVDAASMKGIALFFPGGQGRRQMQLYSLKLVR